jgi:hypothetical protein
MKEVRKLLQKLSKTQRKFFIWYLRILKAHSCFMSAPRIYKYALIHAASTFGTLALFPPAHEVPAVALAVVGGASFAVSYIFMAVLRL